MSVELWLSYVATVLILMSTPGPSHLLMLSNSMQHGLRPSLATAIGDLSANTLQMAAAGLGLASIVLASEQAFLVIKWGGVAYLVYMGITKLHAPGVPASGQTRQASRKGSIRRLYAQGFITSATNPKAVVFFAALFPLFLDMTQPLAPQLTALGATYIFIDGCFLTAYGSSAAWLAAHVRGRGALWINRGSGGLLIGAAVLLGLKDVE